MSSRRGLSKAQRRDLFRHQADQKHHHRKHQQQHRAVRNARCWMTCPDAVDHAEQQRRRADRHEDLKRTEDRDDLQQDQEELRAVARQPDLRLSRSAAAPRSARSARCSRRAETRAWSSSASRSRSAAGGGTRADSSAAPPEAGRQIGNPTLGEIAGQRVQQIVAQRRARRGLRLRATRADDEIVLTEALTSRTRVVGLMLAVAVENQDPLARRRGGCRS